LVADKRDIIPVQSNGKIIGAMTRQDALKILLSN